MGERELVLLEYAAPSDSATPKHAIPPHLNTLTIKLRVSGNSSPPEASRRIPVWRPQSRPSAIGPTYRPRCNPRII